MRIICDVSEDEVYQAWIKSEVLRATDNISSEEIGIIEHPIIGNEQQAKTRKDILLNKLGRSAILNTLPQDVSWKKVALEEPDIEKIYIVPVYDWFLDTGKTFKLKDVPDNLSAHRGHAISQLSPISPTHHEKIHSMINNGQIEGELVMITSAIDTGMPTLIDGTHRGTALLIKGALQGVNTYIGISPNMVSSRWSVENPIFHKVKRDLNQWVEAGLLW
jgi:hypothetical protein